MNDGSDYPPKPISDEALIWIMRLNSGAATRADRAAFAQWRAQSDAHEAAAREAELLWGEASYLHIDRESGLVRPGRKSGGPSRRTVLGGLAGLGLAGAGAYAGREALRRLNADYVTGTAETREVALEDGSRLHMNARTAMAVDFSARTRSVHLLEGQTFFQVAGDVAERPFEVLARGTRVLARGAGFDVDAGLPGDEVGISVTQHSVRLQSAFSNLVVGEEERVIVSSEGRAGAVLHQSRSAALAWLEGMYVAEARPLGEVVAALRAYYPGWIVLRGADLGALPVSAVLDLRTPAQSLDALAVSLPIRVRRVSDYLTVISAA